MCRKDQNRANLSPRAVPQAMMEACRTDGSNPPADNLQPQTELGVHIIDEEILPIAIQVDEGRNAQQCA